MIWLSCKALDCRWFLDINLARTWALGFTVSQITQQYPQTWIWTTKKTPLFGILVVSHRVWSRKLKGSTTHWEVPVDSGFQRSMSLITVRKTPSFASDPGKSQQKDYSSLRKVASAVSGCPDRSIFHSCLSPGSETEKLNPLFSLKERRWSLREGDLVSDRQQCQLWPGQLMWIRGSVQNFALRKYGLQMSFWAR